VYNNRNRLGAHTRLCIIVLFVNLLKEHCLDGGSAGNAFLKALERNAYLRSCSVQLNPLLTTPDQHDRLMSEDANNDAEAFSDRQARAQLIMCLGNTMVSLVEGTETAGAALEAVQADH
jgi:hypothetical protein